MTARLGPARAEEGAYVWQKLMKTGAVISNGTADFRASQYHLRTERALRQDDTVEELRAIMDVFSPRTVDVISVHITLDKDKDGMSQKRFGRTVELEELLAIYVKLAKQSKKVLYMGEFHGDTDANELPRGRIACPQNCPVPRTL